MRNEAGTAVHLLSSDARRFWAKVDRSGSCWPWMAGTGAGGRGVFKLSGKTRTAHRLSLIVATGQNPHDREAAHYCGNVLCVNPDHLRWATRAENEADKAAVLKTAPENTTQRPNSAKPAHFLAAATAFRFRSRRTDRHVFRHRRV